MWEKRIEGGGEMRYVWLYFFVINVFGFLSMYSDKKRAKKKQYRIPEATLFMCALLGGSIGSMIGMYTFRHKTKHWYFKLGIPFIVMIQILSITFLVSTYIMG